jgi:hypothetical protein
MGKKDQDLVKLDKAFIKLRRKSERNPNWWSWMESREGAWIERALRALERVKPSQEEMLLDIVEADLKVEYGLGDPEVLVKKKDKVISALWKLLKITKWMKGERIEVLDQLEASG